MTSAAATLLAPRPRAAALGGRIAEFLLVGGLMLLLFPVLWLYRSHVGLDASEFRVSFIAFYAAYVINDPHFAVTYLLFYKDVKRRAFGGAFGGAQRFRYVLAGFVVPLVLAAWAITALVLDSPVTMGFLIQVMFFFVGWHYVKQGFGVLTVLSARRGVRYSALERKVLLLHCYAGWAYAWASPADPGTQMEEKGVVYTTIAHSRALDLATGVVFAASTIALVWVLARKWRNERQLPPLAPLTGFLAAIWLWTLYSSIDPLMAYVIPALHSIQYLYFVWLLKRNEARAGAALEQFGASIQKRLVLLVLTTLALGFILFHGAPALVDGSFVLDASPPPETMARLGPSPFFAALFTFVNIHHYFMDTVIWRRENPEMRYLVQ